MIFTRFQRCFRPAHRRAFTIVELLVAISILTLIVLVLYGLFDQVQKALRSNIAQVDVHEGGRAGMELMSREMEQIQAGNILTNVNLFTRFFPAIPNRQALPNPGEERLNALEEVFFLSRWNKHWIGTGYRVLAINSNGIPVDFARTGVGTLCRYSLSNHVANVRSPSLYSRVMDVVPSKTNFANFQRVIDGVIDFRVRAYDRNGMLITNNFNTNILSGLFVSTNLFFNNDVEYGYAFTNKALPASLEIQLAVLEPQVLERYRSYPNATVASNYLARQAGAIHLFQQRVPIHMAK
jgi:prepilin-type N-terminal cleavage/methylation domain-containing protein